jgi:modulator of FtsH protease
MAEAHAWEAFYVMAGGATAVLTGLVFVAVTLHVTPIIGNVLHRDRAWSSVAILASQLIIAMAVLVPAQPLRLLGVEILVIAAFWVMRTVRVTRDLSSAMRRLDRPSGKWQVEWPAWIAWVVALTGSGVALVAENGDVGFPLLALAMVGMFSFAIWSAWVLVSEVSG